MGFRNDRNKTMEMIRAPDLLPDGKCDMCERDGREGGKSYFDSDFSITVIGLIVLIQYNP